MVPQFHLADKLFHFSAWALLGLLFFRAYRFYSPVGHYKNALFWVSFLSAALYGISDEVHQYFVPSRTADVLDFLADTAGSLCGTWIGAWWYTLYRPSDKTPDVDSNPIRSVDKSAKIR